MAMLTLKGSTLNVDGTLTAATLYLLARWAHKLGSIRINNQELTAEALEELARQSEQAGEPIRLEPAPDSHTGCGRSRSASTRQKKPKGSSVSLIS